MSKYAKEKKSVINKKKTKKKTRYINIWKGFISKEKFGFYVTNFPFYFCYQIWYITKVVIFEWKKKQKKNLYAIIDRLLLN